MWYDSSALLTSCLYDHYMIRQLEQTHSISLL
jgi:hypothetical protein